MFKGATGFGTPHSFDCPRDLMRALIASPFLPPFLDVQLTERVTILELLKTSGDLSWCDDFVAVRLNGISVPRAWWPHITVKPDAPGLLELCVVPQKGNLLPIVASVALVALTAGIGTFGLPFLGAGFAAGTFGASAIAAGVGIAGQLAISALTAPPSIADSAASQRDLSQAGISANAITRLETLPTVHGKMLVSPPVISPPYTTLDNEELTVNAIVGVQGRCLIENILINGTDITLLEGITYETREGGAADAVLTLAQLTCIQQTDQVTLSNFLTQLETSKNDALIDQVTPANSSPDYHPFTTDGTVDEIWLRFLFPSGIVRADNAALAAVPIRVEIRKVGDVAWRKLPTMHIFDIRKGSGPLRAEAKLKFQTQTSGRHFSNATGEYPIFELTNITGIGQTFEYQSDAYFQNTAWPATSQIPVMTAATTGGVTMSASTELGAPQAAWKAADNNDSTTGWQPSNNQLPGSWLKVDFGSALTIRSYFMASAAASSAAPTNAPLTWYVEGSNDDATYTRLDSSEIDVSKIPLAVGVYQIGTPGSYRYYRWTYQTNNGAANEQIFITHLAPYLVDAPGTNLVTDTLYAGNPATHNSTSDPRCVYGSLDANGATFYLDPAQWLPGAYEVRVKRGVAFEDSVFVETTYSYAGITTSDFFDYRLTGGFYVTGIGQKNYRADAVVEVFSSVSNDVPVNTTGIACIAIEMKNTVIGSISAKMTSYASVYSGGVWTDAEESTTNPAALYRQLLLGHAHPNPPPGEIIDEDELAAWYTRCVTNGRECNFLQQGRSVAEVKAVIASTGYASPRESNMLSIVEDYDRSAEPVTQVLSPLNSKLLGVNIPLPDLEHAIYAEYFDAADDWKIRRDIIYRTGYDANTASLFSTVTYDGFTSTTKVATRAAFDFKQVVIRARTVRLGIGIEGYSLWRGKLVAHNDDVLNTTQAQGLIRSIEVSGGNVVSITVDNIIPFSVNQDALAAFVEGLDLANATGVAIRLSDGTSVVKTLTNVSDGTVCTFTTPFTYAGSGLAEGLMCVFGRAGQHYSRMIVMGVEPQGLETRIVTIAAAGDAALFA